MRCLIVPKSHDKAAVPTKYHHEGYTADINLIKVPLCDYDSLLSAMSAVFYYDPTDPGHKIITEYGRLWILQHDLNCGWLTDCQLQEVIRYYGLDKIYWESE